MNPDFLDLLRAFSAADVRFMVVGAYALALHGHPRATGDLDVWVDATPDNAPRIMRALAEFGAPMHDLHQADFERPGVTYQIGLPPARTTGAFGDIQVPFIDRESFVRNKRAVGRPKDLADLRRAPGPAPRERMVSAFRNQPAYSLTEASRS